MESRIEELLRQLTLAERVSMLAGESTWNSMPVERLGIPAMKMTDGPNGARGSGGLVGGTPTAAFPVGISLAATWNPELVERIGQALGEEAKAKGAQVLLGPTVNIHRSPLNGRNFECYSEDPYLTARLAGAYVKGVQSRGVATSIKHYVCNDSEYQRNSISSEIRERALREIYLPPFKAAVEEAGTWSIMASYNKVNGTFAGDSRYLLTEILRGEWGFDGFVTSDWFGVKSVAEAVNAGLDIEMPGPTQWRGEKLLKAIEKGEVAEAEIDERVRSLLRVLIRTGAFERSDDGPEQTIDTPEQRALLREAAAEGIVLLKNEGHILPINPDAVKSIAIIGPNARTAQIMGGGSAQVNAYYVVTPYEGIINQAGDRFELGYELGCTNHKSLPHLDISWVKPRQGDAKRGLTVEYFTNLDLEGEPVHTTTIGVSEYLWFGDVAPGVDPGQFSARLSGTLTPPETGIYQFSLVSAGLSRFYLDGQEVIDNWTEQKPGSTYFGAGSAEMLREIKLEGGRSYDLRLDYSRRAVMLAAVRLGCLPPIPADAIDRAAKLAAGSDVALVFVGLNGEWESEGFDRPDMELVGEQTALIEKVAAANPRTVVVLNTGSPISMDWLDKVAGVVQAWYPGQECGNAIADVLFGAVNPSGKLTQTTPMRLEDNPAFINYPGEGGKVYYGEGIFVGYRYYEKKQIAPRLPFGFGLSYTYFHYSNLKLSAAEIGPGDQLRVSVDVTNAGDRAGQEIVQLYVCDPIASVARPEKELKGFAKIALQPGETKTVTLTLDRESLAFFDEYRMQWVAEAGDFEALIGSSSQDIRATATFRLTETSVFGGPHRKSTLTGRSPLRDILDDPRARAIVEEYVGSMAKVPQMAMAMGFTLEQVAMMVPDLLTEENLAAIEAAFAEL